MCKFTRSIPVQIQISETYRRFFETLFWVSLCVLAFGIPTSTVFMSVAQFGFGVAVFAVPDYVAKLRRLFSNPVALIWLGLYFLFMLGGSQSADTDYFLKELRTKMPIWVLPVALALMPQLEQKKVHFVLHCFLAGTFLASAAGLYNLLFTDISDYRQLSPMVSHIRLGIYLTFSLFLILRFMLLKKPFRLLPRAVYAILGTAFLLWLFYLNSLTGILFFAILAPAVGLYFLLHNISWPMRRALVVFILFGVAGTAFYLTHTVRSFYRVNDEPVSSLPVYTREGNPYLHDTNLHDTENGNYVWRYLEFAELERAWNLRSALPYSGNDNKGNVLKATLCRYLASRNLPRDAEGILALSDKEIHDIENGVPNYLYARSFNIKGRIYETLWEWEAYKGTGDPNGKSLSARVELWKTALRAIGENPGSGYGTGDVRQAIKKQLIQNDSKLVYYGQFGPHNQYLATALALGIPGLLWMLFAFFSPLFFYKKYKPTFLFYTLLGLLLLAALNEDIFETQASVTFFAFAYHMLLADKKENNES